MKVLNLSAGCECAGTLGIGYRGENDRTEVRFDFSAWAEEFGAPGAVELFVRRQGDTDAYPVALTIDGSEAVWTVSSVDTAAEGLGEAEFVWLLNGVVAKTAVWGTYVAPDIGQPTDEPPDPYESWMEALGEMAAGTLINAQRAENAQTGAEAAEAAAETAQRSAEDAQAAAEVAQRKAESAQDAAEAAEAAAETAQGSAEDAQAAAEAAQRKAESAQDAAEAAEASASSSAIDARQSVAQSQCGGGIRRSGSGVRKQGRGQRAGSGGGSGESGARGS